MSDTVKPRVRVPAGSDRQEAFVSDSFQNFLANIGQGTANLSTGSSYGFNPLSRNRTLIEWMYRGSWLVRKVVDCPADDMTREGLHIESDMPPDRIDQMTQAWSNMQVWQRLNAALKWARLYGGSLAVVMIDGQDTAQPLRLDTIDRGQFKGLMVLDRWMVWPHVEDLVDDYGPDYATPRYYEVVADARAMKRMKIHHSRCIRLDGVELPYWQKMAENEWGLSVIEPLWDRMVAFDSATQGAAQLIYKAHLRVVQIPKLRELIAAGGSSYQAVLKQINAIRVMQTNEGLTLLDAEDVFSANTYNFGGLSDMMIQFGQQVSGAADVPMTRLFGQSPAGMNSTGESDLRNYYDGIKSQQEARLRRPLKMLLDVTHRHLFGAPLPEGFNYSFKPLWQLSELEKSQIATAIVNATSALAQDQLFTPEMALKEIRQSSRVTGFGSNITDEDIKMAAAMPPPPDEMAGEGGEQAPGEGGAEEDQPKMLGGPERPTVGQLSHKEHIAQLAAARANDRRSIIDFAGMQVVIETAKGERRIGYGWAVVMPADYGYISGTSSKEGPTEQMDAFVGPNLESDLVWVIEQRDPDSKLFDEHKVMLGFDSKEQALTTYSAAFSDGRGADRVGVVRQLSPAALRDWLENWQYGDASANRPPLRSA